MEEDKRAAGGKARAEALSPEQRKEIAQAAAAARWHKGTPRATHDGELHIGDAAIPCYVLENEDRVLSTRGIMGSLGRTWRGRKYTGTDLPVFLEAKNLKPLITEDILPVLAPVVFKTPRGVMAEGFRADILPTICEIYLEARNRGILTSSQIPIAAQCEILVRGLSRVGIVALVDEATGYQRDRAVDALAQILEKFIAKELRPWVRTFPDDYYQELYRLRGLDFPNDTVKKPSYFGHITNDIIYKRLAPGVLEELKKVTPKGASGRHKQQLHRRLTSDVGHPKLMAHMDSVITVMKLTDNEDYDGFIEKLDKVKPRYEKTLPLPFKDED